MKVTKKRLLAAIICLMLCVTALPMAYAQDTDEVKDEPLRSPTFHYVVSGLTLDGNTATCFGHAIGRHSQHEIRMFLRLQKYVGFGEWGEYKEFSTIGTSVPGTWYTEYEYNLPSGSYKLIVDAYTYLGTTCIERMSATSKIKYVAP